MEITNKMSFSEIQAFVNARNDRLLAAEKMEKKIAKAEKKLAKEQKKIAKVQRKLAKAGDGAVAAGATPSSSVSAAVDDPVVKQLMGNLAALINALPGVVELTAAGKTIAQSAAPVVPEVPEIAGMQVVQARPGSVTVEAGVAPAATPVADVQAAAVKVASIDPTAANTAVGNALLNSRRGNAKAETKK